MITNELYEKGRQIIKKTATRNLIALLIIGSGFGFNAILSTEANALPKIVSDGIPIEQKYPANKLIKEQGKYITKEGIIRTKLALPSTTIESSDLIKVISVYNPDEYVYSNYSYTLPDDLTDEQKDLYNRIANMNNDEMYLTMRSEEGEADLVDYALDEIGVIFNQNSNSTPYGIWYYENIDGSYDFKGAPWCAMFVSYSLSKVDKDLPMYAAVKTGAAKCQELAAKGIGEWHWSGDYTPKRNDIYFDYLGNNSHTGIVMASDGTYQYTIEGNTCDDEGSYVEGCVNTERRTLSYISGGYYTPAIKTNENGLAKSQAFIDEKINSLTR